MDPEASFEPTAADAVFAQLWVFAKHVTSCAPDLLGGES